MDIARVVMGRLIHAAPLERRHRDDALRGEWAGHRECHLAPDWLLTYGVREGVITFERTGTHQDLFRE